MFVYITNMILKILVELIGTFIFLGVIRMTGDPISIGLALITAIYFGGKVSGGHFNPAVTVMQTVDGKLDITQASMYIISQVVGGLMAFRYSQLANSVAGNNNVASEN